MEKRITRSKAIRLKCLECCGDSRKMIRECPTIFCPLWRYRMGHEERDELYGGKGAMKEEVEEDGSQ